MFDSGLCKRASGSKPKAYFMAGYECQVNTARPKLKSEA